MFVTLKPFEERVKEKLTTESILNDLRAQMQALARSLRAGDPAALGARHRHRRRLQALRAGPRRPWSAGAGAGGRRRRRPGQPDARPGSGLHAVQRLDAAGLRRHRPHQGRDAGRADLALLRHADDLYGLDLRQRLQHPGPDLPGHRAGRQSVPALDPRCRNAADPVQRIRHGAARRRRDLPRHHRAVSRAALQSFPGRRGAGRHAAGLLHRPGDRRHGKDPRQPAVRLRLRMDRDRACRRRSRATPP